MRCVWNVVIALLAVLSAAPDMLAGWNYGSRKNCKVFAKYRVEAHAGWKSDKGGQGNVTRDTGCTYAHAGPIRSYTGNVLLAEAEGYIGNSSFWGYARSWNYYDGIANLLKKGVAGQTPERMLAPSIGQIQPACGSASARNHCYLSEVVLAKWVHPQHKTSS